MSKRNVTEFTTRNMSAFNEVCPDSLDVQYASFGAQRKELQLNEMLRGNYWRITDHLLEVQTDGMLRVEEARWGTYLMTFEHDHLEVAGLNPRVDVLHIANLMTDQCRLAEVNNDARE